MDSFDDLLAPSRNILEDNPFSDPFSKRSSSPDPWANPYASEDVYNSPFAASNSNQYDATTPISPTTDTHPGEEHLESSATPSETISSPVDPLDSAQSAADDEQRPETPPLKLSPTTIPRSPGFKESIDTSIESQALKSTIKEAGPKPTEDVEEKESETAPKPTEDVVKTAPEPQAIPPESPSIITPEPEAVQTLSSQIPRSTEHAFEPSSSGWDPLDKPSEPTHTFTNVSLGAETLNGSTGGWTAPSDAEPWSNEQPVVSRIASEEDSDDDKPIGQTLNKRFSQQGNSSPPVMQKQNSTSNRPDLRPVFVITVDDPQKVGDPIRSFTMYTVHTRTTSPLYQKSAFSVLRRYSDFLWLYETLSNNNPGVVVPPVPEKSPFGRFDDQFVKQRRFALEKCIQKIANHPILGKDPDLKLFLESDTFSLDIKHRKAEIANERGGLMASIGQSITGPRFYETDEWFDRQKAYLDSLEAQLRGLAKAIDMVAKTRTEQSSATNEFANSLSDLSSADIGKQLVQSVAGLADVEKKAHDLQVIQSEQDMVTFMGTVDEYSRLISSVRLAFTSRVRVYHMWRNAESELQRVKLTHEKNRAQGRIPNDRLGYSLTQIADAERRAGDAKMEFEQVSRLVKSEVARFEQERIEDFKDSLHAFLEGMISRQKELIAHWEGYQQTLLKRVGATAPATARATVIVGTPQPPIREAEE